MKYSLSRMGILVRECALCMTSDAPKLFKLPNGNGKVVDGKKNEQISAEATVRAREGQRYGRKIGYVLKLRRKDEDATSFMFRNWIAQVREVRRDHVTMSAGYGGNGCSFICETWSDLYFIYQICICMMVNRRHSVLLRAIFLPRFPWKEIIAAVVLRWIPSARTRARLSLQDDLVARRAMQAEVGSLKTSYRASLLHISLMLLLYCFLSAFSCKFSPFALVIRYYFEQCALCCDGRSALALITSALPSIFTFPSSFQPHLVRRETD